MEPINISSDDGDDYGQGPGHNKKLKPNNLKSDPAPRKKIVGNLPGNKCVYVNCGKSSRDDINLKKYRFPTDEALAKQWVVNSGDLTLLKIPHNVLRRKIVCSDHFDDNDFVNPNIRRAIKKGVVPKPYKTDLFFHPFPQPPTSLDSTRAVSYSSPHQEGIQLNKTIPSNKEANELPDKPEIIEVINDDNIASGPTQCNNNSHGFIKANKDICQSLTSVFKSSPQEIIVNKDAMQIIIKTLINPPKELLKQIEQQNVNVTNSGNIVKVAPVQQVAMTKNPIISDMVENSSQPSTSRIIAAKNKDDIKKDTSNRENFEAKNDGSEKNEKNKDNLCVVPKCTGNVTHYFKVPDNLRRRNIWDFCLTLPELKSGDLICEQHFIPEDMLSRPNDSHIGVLKHFAVPSSRKVLIGCCIYHCVNRNQNTENMFPIPIWSHYSPWIMYTSNVKVNNVHDWQQYRVCELHFTQDSLLILQKGYDMVPSINLPSKKYYEQQLQTYLQNRESALDQLSDISDRHVAAKSANAMEYAMHEYCSFLGCKFNKDSAHIRFYKFPVDSDRAVKWLEACNRSDILLKPRDEIQKFMDTSIGICFPHKNEIEKKIRRKEMTNNVDRDGGSKTAVRVSQRMTEVIKDNKKKGSTTLDITEENTKSGDPNQSAGEENYVPVREYCAFVNCSTYIKDIIKKYRFPADKELLTQWIEATGIPKTLPEDTIRSLFVCGKHFKEDQYTDMGTLILSSVPAPHTEFIDSTSHEGNQHWILKQRQTRKIYVPACPVPNKTTSSTVVPDKQTISTSRNAVFSVSSKKMFSTPSEATSKSQIKMSKAEEKSPIVLQEEECVVQHCRSTSKTNILYPFPEGDQTIMIRWVTLVENKESVTVSRLQAYINKKICDKHFESRYQIGKTLLRQDAAPTLDLVEEIPEEEIDTSIVWKQCDSDILNTDISGATRAPHIKGNVILHENSIEFPNMGRELRFGKDCPKLGYLRKFPYSLNRMTKKVARGREVDTVNNGHKLQVHTAIIVDDDDDAEREAIKIITKIMMENTKLANPQNRKGGRPSRL